jgi:transposase
LDPRARQSGAVVGQRTLSQRGPGALRHALYLAALVATRHRPEWRERSQTLRARGQRKKAALPILSRALLTVIYHLLMSGDSSDADKIKPRAVGAAAGA